MQTVKVTLTVDLAELMMQVGESLKGTPQVGEGFRPLIAAETLTPKKRKVFVVQGEQKRVKPVRRGTSGQDRSVLLEAIKTVLSEAEVPLLPKAVQQRLLDDKRFKKLLIGEPKNLVAGVMFYYGHFPKGAEVLERVADGYRVRSNVEVAEESMVLG